MDASEAVKYGLADGLKYEDEVMEELKAKLGYTKKDELKMIAYNKYKDYVKSKKTSANENKIAVVYAEGEINDGKEVDGVIGGKGFVKILQDLQKDDAVKGVILRVNSPGGSAFASEQINHEIIKLRAKKPVVTSMGDYAASGGYYISCGADRIFANPNTITGSIGVFGIVPNLQTFLDHKLGITIDRVETHPHADFFSITKPFDEMELAKMNEMVVGIYDDFLSRVSNGRGMTVAQVDSIARGRVWTGTEAKKIGLVDQLGTLQDAIDFAANAVGMTQENVVIKTLPKMEDPITELLGGVAEAKQNILLKEVTGEHYQEVATLRSLIARPGVYTRLPFVLEVK
jgi:protease-4